MTSSSFTSPFALPFTAPLASFNAPARMQRRTAAVVLALAACSVTALVGIDASAQGATPAALPTADAPSADVVFPSIESSYLKTGSFVGPDHVRRITPGLGKDQVRLELGNPQFSEGLAYVREWDYTFNFYTGKGNAYVTCQFKIKFDRDGNDLYRVASTHWKGVDCESYLQPAMMAQAAPAAPAPVVVSAPMPKRLTLGADGLFRFARSGLGDLLPEGRAKLEALAAQLKANSVLLSSVVITGHTDRIGSTASNMALSQARADTVRDFLVKQGIDGKVIRAYAAGESRPLTRCTGETPTPALVACLQPDRRVEIDVVAQQ